MNAIPIIEYFKIIVPTAISLIAAIFSILTYRRNRRIENENYIYKTKHENYSKILFDLGNVIDLLQVYISDANVFSKEQEHISNDILENEVDKLYEQLQKIDNAISNFENFVIAHSLVIPKNVLEKFDSLNDILSELEIPEPEDKYLNKTLLNLDKEIKKIIDFANELNEIIRNDLNVEELNFYLFKRLKN